MTSSRSFQPARNLQVNGIEIAARTPRRIFSTRGKSRSRPDPPLHFTTLLTGHPKLMSRTSKPRSSQTRAASAITAGSAPSNCAEMGCSSGSKAKYFNVLVGFRACSDALTPWELVNSVIMSPQPPRLRMKRRKTVSVTPAMGAKTVAGEIFTGPIKNSVGNSCMPFISLILPGILGETKCGREASDWLGGRTRMKPLQIALLVVAGAVGGAVIMKVSQRPQPAQSTAPAASQEAAPAAAQNPPPSEAEPVPVAPAQSQPAEAAEAKPAPFEHRASSK